jgi:GNAT superfamily N-acetyltransferase
VGAYAFADLALARRLERTEASANAAFAEARARHVPVSGACWREVAGAYAIFDGLGSPLTQTFGLGIFAEPADDDLAEIERFFAERGSSTHHEVSPLAGVELAGRLAARGYRPIEMTSVMHRPVQPAAAPAPGDARAPDDARASDVVARAIAPGEEALYGETASRGWSASDDLAAFIREFAAIGASSRGSRAFLAELDGKAIAAGSLIVYDGVALFAGASTVPEWRGRGAQAALLAARMDAAAHAGCDLAMMCAAPGSASQRNAERLGFRIAYTRMKWARELGALGA